MMFFTRSPRRHSSPMRHARCSISCQGVTASPVGHGTRLVKGRGHMWLDKKILVATDFSEPAMAAADAALALAQQFSQPLVLTHVYGVPGTKYAGVDLDLTADFVRSVE